jgi:signal transduction histidine kinase
MQPRDESLSRLLSVHNLQTNLIRSCIHEIKSPLGGISGYADLIEIALEGEQDFQKIGRYRDQIAVGLDEVSMIIDQIHEIAKQSVSIRPWDIYRKTDIRKLIQSVCTTMEVLSQGRANSLEFIDEAPPTVLILDRLLLRLVVMNLIANALKYTAKGKNIQVRLMKTNSTFYMQVKSPETKVPSKVLEEMFLKELDQEFESHPKGELDQPYYFGSDCYELINPTLEASVDSENSFTVELKFVTSQTELPFESG